MHCLAARGKAQRSGSGWVITASGTVCKAIACDEKVIVTRVKVPKRNALSLLRRYFGGVGLEQAVIGRQVAAHYFQALLNNSSSASTMIWSESASDPTLVPS